MSDDPQEPEPTLEDVSNSMAVVNHSMRPVFTDQMMWLAIRGALLSIVTAIETMSDGGPLAKAVRMGLIEIVRAIELRWNLKRRKAN